jgi:DNA polymerase
MKREEIKFQINAYMKDEWVRISDENSSISGKYDALKNLEYLCFNCRKCRLYEKAKNLVFSDGSPDASLVFIGEAPGAEEDIQGKPFVGRAGRLLTVIVERAGLPRNEVYICNILKHRPPENRNPLPDEIAACTPYLVEQLSIIKPKTIVTLGNFSSKFMLNTDEGITRLRGNIMKSHYGYDIIPTYHPAAVLRNVNLQSDLESDIRKAVRSVKSQKSLTGKKV